MKAWKNKGDTRLLFPWPLSCGSSRREGATTERIGCPGTLSARPCKSIRDKSAGLLTWFDGYRCSDFRLLV